MNLEKRTLDGEIALVTGAASGAGLAIARTLSSAGARVCVCDIDADAVAQVAAESPGILALVADVAEEGAVDQAFLAIENELGPVRVLVNNVGISGSTAPIENVVLADWERTLRVNLASHFMCIRRAVPHMKSQGGGLVVNISSASAKVGLPLRAPYVVSKGAVMSLTMTLARELGPFGIRVNAILPGAIRGKRMTRVIRDKAQALGVSVAEHERSLLRYISLRTMVEADDVAAMVAFLASPFGARVSGQMLGVDGNVEWEE